MQPQQPSDNEYHPKTIFSEPQVSLPQQAPPNPNAIYGATPLATEIQAASASKKSSKKGLFIALGGGTALILVLIIGVVIFSASQKGSKKATSNTKSQAAILQPATEIELEQINSSITQDLAGIDDEKDYPTSSLADKTLGL